MSRKQIIARLMRLYGLSREAAAALAALVYGRAQE